VTNGLLLFFKNVLGTMCCNGVVFTKVQIASVNKPKNPVRLPTIQRIKNVRSFVKTERLYNNLSLKSNVFLAFFQNNYYLAITKGWEKQWQKEEKTKPQQKIKVS
jgi:hypothetical protein